MTKAKLGLESAFYFDEKTQSWVDGSAPASGTASGAAEIGAPPVMQPPNATMAGRISRRRRAERERVEGRAADGGRRGTNSRGDARAIR